jgi:hypothetical protein
LGKRAGASDDEVRDTYWVSLLANLGCTGFAHDEGLMGAGDDRSLRSGMSMFSVEDPLRSAREALGRIAPEVSLARRLRVFAGVLTDRTLFERFQRAMCDTSIRLAEMVGAGPRVLAALDQLCERSDGRGVPGRVEGDSMVLPMRLQQIGHIVEIAHHRAGRAGAIAVVRRRAGRHFDPHLAKVFVEEQGPLADRRFRRCRRLSRCPPSRRRSRRRNHRLRPSRHRPIPSDRKPAKRAQRFQMPDTAQPTTRASDSSLLNQPPRDRTNNSTVGGPRR